MTNRDARTEKQATKAAGELLQRALHEAVNLLDVYESLPNCTRDNTFRQAFDRIAEEAGYENADHAYAIMDAYNRDMSELYRGVYENAY